MVGALPQGSTSRIEQKGIQASKVRLVADCCVCQQHASANPSRALAALQIDIQDFSLVQAIRSCVVDGANLLALGNEQGLQVLYSGPYMCCWHGQVTFSVHNVSVCGSGLLLQVLDAAQNNLLYVWKLPRSEVPSPHHADFVSSVCFNLDADGSVQLCAGCSSGAIQVQAGCVLMDGSSRAANQPWG